MRGKSLIGLAAVLVTLSTFPLDAQEPVRSTPEVFMGVVIDAGGVLPGAWDPARLAGFSSMRSTQRHPPKRAGAGDRRGRREPAQQ